MAYNYGPPPPAPPPAPPANNAGGYPQYGQPYQQGPQRGGHGGRGGRGGLHGDRGGYHPSPPAYGYNPQQPPQPYGQPSPAHYAGPQQPPQAPYPQPQPQPQQWHPEQAQQPQQAPQHNQLLAQNYHPNYAPQIYQQQPAQPQPYNPQQPYSQPPQPPYNQAYPTPAPQAAPPAQQWGGQPPPNQNQFGGGRGGRGGYSDRGGKSHNIMGPPIRMGFESANPQGHPAPVSSPYPPQPYPGPTPYAPAPYQGYPPPAPYMPGPPQYEGHSGHNRHHNRGGGFHNNNFKSRPQFGGDKMRNRNNRGPAQTPPNHHQKPDAASAGKKKKRKTNTLGLTPGDDSDEDDENEEERLNEMYGADAPNPLTSSDIQAWLAERRVNFPTKARVESKKAFAKIENGEAKKESEGGLSALEKQQQKAEKLRKQLEKVESSIKRKREQQDEGDEMRNGDESSLSSSESDDDKPEIASVRQETYLPPPPKKADPTKHCKYYSTGGTCGKKGKCRFVHDPNVREAALKEREMNGGRMTLQQRLVLNDKDQEDLTIVQTLKYLQDKGVMRLSGGSDLSPSGLDDQDSQSLLPQASVKKESSNGNGLPPIPPPSANASTPVVKYNGWNLSGFGNTGVKSGEI